MNISQKILSDITVHMKYARFVPELSRRETWEEIVDRNKQMHIKKYPDLKDQIEQAYKFVYDRKVLPSMRSMQFAGKPIEVTPSRIYNCAYAPVDHIDVFSEIMFLLLGGTGMGYSVQYHHIEQLPEIQKPNPDRKRRFLIGDSIEGWSDSIKVLMKSYFGKHKSTPIFDFSDIRSKGARLVTSGGKAPGPQPLKDCIHNIRAILDSKQNGDKLTSLEVHDIVCHIADAVLAGGIRRAALICLFSADDSEMLSCKSGPWWEKNAQRGRANNSAVLLRHRVTKDFFKKIWKRTEESNSGEPGIHLTNDKDWGSNPCFSYDTKILTAYGYEDIGSLEGQEVEFINKNGEVVPGTVFESGSKAIYKINLSNRRSIKTTLNHVFMLSDGTEKEAQFITKEDRLMPFFQINDVLSEYVKYGFIQGDGQTGRLRSERHLGLEVHIGENDEDVATLFGVEHGKTDYYLGGYNEILKSLGFDSSSLPERLLPYTIENWKDEDILMFLKGLYSANGCVIKGHRVAFKTTNLDLVYELKDLLKRFNIDSYYTRNKAKKVKFSNGEYLCKESYDLNIARYDSVINFAELIGFVQSYKQEDLRNLILLKGPKVISSSVENVEKVYDFTLYDNTHWGVVEGIIAHNCHEIALRPNQFCNLCEVNVSNLESQEDFNGRVRAAAFIGTLQAGYTDFHYLREVWQKTTEKEALIGVSLTGIGSGVVFNYNLEEAASTVLEENERVANLIGINKAARTTTVKPAGTTSLVLGTSSGIHAWHNDYYIRRIRVGKNEAIYSYLLIHHPDLIEDCKFRPHDTAVISIPQKAPSNSILRTESPFDLLERINKVYNEWIKTGHREGYDTHNVSATVSLKHDEWKDVGEWMWKNRENYTGLSVLPYDGGTYVQAPFEDISKTTYYEKFKVLDDIDLTKVVELDDQTDLSGELACAGGACEIT